MGAAASLIVGEDIPGELRRSLTCLLSPRVIQELAPLNRPQNPSLLGLLSARLTQMCLSS